MRTRTSTLLALTVGAGLALAGCGQASTPAATTTTTASTAAATTTGTGTGTAGAVPTPDGKTYQGEGLEISKTWVKAIPDIAKGKMTGIFGTIKNTSTSEIVIVSGSQDQSAKTELHETTMIDGAMKMREIQGGYTIPAGGTFELKPGGNHVMIMDMTKPLPAGATVKVTLTTKDGKKLAFDAVAWPFPGGGNEPYVDKTGMGTATPAMSTTR